MIDFAPSILHELPLVLREYLDANQVCDKHRQHIELHVRRFDEWMHRRETSRLESDSALISAWLAQLAAQPNLGPTTVNAHRGTVLSLVRFATSDGDPLPRADRIRRQKTPQKVNVAFTQDEIRAMLAAAPRYQPMTERTYGRGIAGDVIPRHRPDGVRWSVWWEAFVRVGYESGQYLSDLRLIPWRHVGADGAITFTRHKTGKLMSFRLSPKALWAAKKIGHETLLLPWDFEMGSYFPREFKKFCRFARVRELTPKSLRRSAITYTYMESGEEAARVLAGHSSFATTARHYIDYSIARRPIVSPPPL